MKLLQVFMLMMVPAVALAKYDPDAIKNEVTEYNEIFQVSSWKMTDKGNGWISKTQSKNYVITIKSQGAALFQNIASPLDSVRAMTRCMEFGLIGTGVKNDEVSANIINMVGDAKQSQSTKATVVNGVRFEVTSKELVGDKFRRRNTPEYEVYGCLLQPEKES